MSRSTKKKAAAIRKARATYGDVMRTRYYATIAKHPCRCAATGKQIRVGEPMVFRADGPVTLSMEAACADPIARDFRTSTRYERWLAQQRARGNAERRGGRAALDDQPSLPGVPSPSRSRRRSRKQPTARVLQTPEGPVSYADSGWTEAEWAVIAGAMSRMGLRAAARPSAVAPRPLAVAPRHE